MQISNGLWILICAVVGYWLVSIVLRKLSAPKTAAQSNVGQSGNQEIPKKQERIVGLSIEAQYRHVLGVSYDAGEHEIKAAYKELLMKYHPDKVSHLGDEFIDIAGTRARELVEAYEFFKRKYEW